jgi:hypothetical protein
VGGEPGRRRERPRRRNDLEPVEELAGGCTASADREGRITIEFPILDEQATDEVTRYSTRLGMNPASESEVSALA